MLKSKMRYDDGNEIWYGKYDSKNAMALSETLNCEGKELLLVD